MCAAGRKSRPEFNGRRRRCNSASLLALIDEIDLLRQLYGTILIPNAVIGELSHQRTPTTVREWIGGLPQWANVVFPVGSAFQFESLGLSLGLGEREAIAIAQKKPTSILLTDDRQAREAAASMGIQTVPTIRILSTAADLGLVDFKEAFQRL